MRSAVLIAVAGLLVSTACASTTTTTGGVASTTSGPTTGQFVWHDLSTDDLPAAQRFYGGLLGWEFREATRLGARYVVASHAGRAVGGLVAVAPVAGQEVSQWVAYASVANVDAAVAAVEQAGGRTLIAPLDVPSAGRAAVVIDPQGAVLGLARLTGGDPADPPAPEEGTFFWMEYLARDPAAAASFYTSTFGYQQEVTERLGPNAYVVLSLNRPRAGILPLPQADMRPVWLPSILVADPAALATRATALGGTVLLAPHPDVRKGSLAVVADPSGAIVALQKYPF
ncbi:MAG: VOC family protein [Actinomycetota bacterium]|jgi:predicted enzyme related to lactoylglutathione lyase|nr:VOC family protein [Actinomycetota bacterium]